MSFMPFNNVIQRIQSKYLTSFALILTFFICVAYLFYPLLFQDVWPKTHEGFRYLYLFDHFQEAFKTGHRYPRWLANAYGGYGYPSFVFYQPGFFFLVLACSYLGFDAVLSIQFCLFSVTLFGLLGVYVLIRELSDRKTAIFTSFLYLLTPYLYLNLFVRGDLSEYVSILLSPWAFYFLLLLAKKNELLQPCKYTIFALTISIFIVIITHPTTALFFLPLFTVTALYLIHFSTHRKYFLWSVFVGTALALLLSSPYWFTVFQLKNAIQYENAFSGIFVAKLHTVNALQFFSRQWDFGVSLPGNADTMSFQLGIFHFSLASIGAFFGRKKRIIQISFILYILLILMMTNLAIPLWDNIELFKFVQFPWRILSVIALLQIICIAGIMQLKLDDKYKMWAYSTLCLIALWWHQEQFTIKETGQNPSRILNQHRISRLHQLHTFTVKNEMMPNSAQSSRGLQPRGRFIPIVQSDSLSDVVYNNDHNSYFIHVTVTATDASQVIINQLYFPGWRISINGKTLSTQDIVENVTHDGRMLLKLNKSGKYEISAYYDGPPGWRLRNTLIIFFVMTAVILIIYVDATMKTFRQRLST